MSLSGSEAYSDVDRVGDQIERVSGVRFAGEVIRAVLERDPACCAFLGNGRERDLLAGGNQSDRFVPLLTRAHRLRDALSAQGYPDFGNTLPLTGSPNDGNQEG